MSRIYSDKKWTDYVLPKFNVLSSLSREQLVHVAILEKLGTSRQIWQRLHIIVEDEGVPACWKIKKRRMNEMFVARRESSHAVYRGLVESGDAVVRGGRRSDLSALPLQSIKYSLICRGTETAVYSIFLVVLVSLTQSLGTVIECVAEWLVYACEDIATGHEDLENTHVSGTA